MRESKRMRHCITCFAMIYCVMVYWNIFVWFEVISLRCLLVAVVLWPMCCHTGMPCRRHRTWHRTPPQYTDTGPTYRCAIHGTSHWNTQLPISMSWMRPDLKSFPDLPHKPPNAQLYDAVIVVASQKLVPYTYQPGLEPGTCGVRIHYTTRSPTAASLEISSSYITVMK